MIIFSIFVIVFLCVGTFSKYINIRLILGTVLFIIVVLFLVFSITNIVDNFAEYLKNHDFGCYFSDRKTYCLTDWALLSNDTKYCEKESSGYCFSKLAWERGDVSLCEKINPDRYSKGYCYTILAIKTLDKSLCDKGLSILKDVKNVNQYLIQRDFDSCINTIDINITGSKSQ